MLLGNLLATHVKLYSFDDSIFTNLLFLLKAVYIHDYLTIVIVVGMGWGIGDKNV